MNGVPGPPGSPGVSDMVSTVQCSSMTVVDNTSCLYNFKDNSICSKLTLCIILVFRMR